MQNDWLDRCHFGDVRAVLRRMIADGVRVNTIVTSPPYWGLRSYLPDGHPDKAREIGSEPTLREFISTLTEVFDLCRQILADDGTAWINMGDSYSSGGRPSYDADDKLLERGNAPRRDAGLKPKDLIGQPWRLAFALQDAGWYLRQDIIWEKPNPMPESVRDRCTKAHEYIFLLSKSPRYYFDQEAIKEPVNGGAHARRPGNVVPPKGQQAYEDGDARHRTKAGLLAYAQKVARPAGWASNGRHDAADWMTEQGVGRRVGPPGNPAERKLAAPGSGTKNNASFDEAMSVMPATRNRRSVWTVASEPYSGAHFATFPTKLIEPCILAGTGSRGHCPECGAHWRRKTEPVVQVGHTGSTESAYPQGSTANRLAMLRQAAREQGMEYTGARRTVGWEPGCNCGVDPVPDVVLDPFFGSGTTGQVAQALGRHFIGIELNRDYEALQAERLQQPSLMLEVA